MENVGSLPRWLNIVAAFSLLAWMQIMIFIYITHFFKANNSKCFPSNQKTQARGKTAETNLDLSSNFASLKQVLVLLWVYLMIRVNFLSYFPFLNPDWGIKLS